MRFRILLVVFVTVLHCKSSFGQRKNFPKSPCPDKFQYLRSGDERVGLITIDNPHYDRTTLEVTLSQKGTETTNAGQLTLRNEDKVSEIIEANEPLTYKLVFPFPNVVPRVTSIKLDDFEICTGRPYSNPSTKMTLKHSIDVSKGSDYSPPSASVMSGGSQVEYLGGDSIGGLSFSANADQSTNTKTSSAQLSEASNTRPSTSTESPNNQNDLDFTANVNNPFLKKIAPIDINLRHRNPPPPNVDTDEPEPEPEPPTPIQYINFICGRENLKKNAIKLNVNGSPIVSSRFPWIVAIFKKKKNDERIFQCGGSLISTMTVLSAAHCFFIGLQPIPTEKILASLGRHNLSNWSEMEAFNVNAERIITHPDFNPRLTSYDADIALLHLQQSVVFTNAIKPICRWLGKLDPREIEDVAGVIIGWGSDGHQRTTTVPTLVNATVVSRSKCIRSNIQFLTLTSERTLCAGNLDGSGPCMGDSGSGLMIRHQNKWMLRGTVSASVGNPTRPCILDQYSIYSDTAMFNEWIDTNMLV